LAKGTIFRRIFHTNRKGGFYGVFRYRSGNREGKRSLKRAYFPLCFRPLYSKYPCLKIEKGGIHLKSLVDVGVVIRIPVVLWCVVEIGVLDSDLLVPLPASSQLFWPFLLRPF
jgi:hypothetical protein